MKLNEITVQELKNTFTTVVTRFLNQFDTPMYWWYSPTEFEDTITLILFKDVTSDKYDLGGYNITTGIEKVKNDVLNHLTEFPFPNFSTPIYKKLLFNIHQVLQLIQFLDGIAFAFKAYEKQANEYMKTNQPRKAKRFYQQIIKNAEHFWESSMISNKEMKQYFKQKTKRNIEDFLPVLNFLKTEQQRVSKVN